MSDKKRKSPLSVTHPELAKQAVGWDPETITSGSGRKLTWHCKKGHNWDAAVGSRVAGNGCPYCAGKKPVVGETDLLTLSPEIAKEADGWDPRTVTRNSGKRVNWKCEKSHRWVSSVDQRQRSGCPYCAGKYPIQGENDLGTLNPGLAIEANGWNPSEFLPKSNQKKSWKCLKGHNWDAVISDRTNGNGCPYCSGRKVETGVNDLLTLNPQLASEADGWDPSLISFGSEKKLSWRCINQHTWTAVVFSRNSGVGCPYCNNSKVWKGFNDLLTTHPELSAEAEGWDPSTVTYGSSNKNYLWKCAVGHTWKSNVKNRTTGQGCPSCSVSGFDPNSPAFLYFLEHQRWLMLQIGITNDPDKRLTTHKKLGWDLVEIRGPMDGHLTQQWETAILRMLKSKGADLSNSNIAGKFDGYSEAWSRSTFSVKTIKELMDLTEEFEGNA